MRKLKLQMQTTIDGFVARPNGELDWMMFDWDDELKKYVNELIDSSDTILMGRKMTDEFVNYWTKAVENPESPEYEFAILMADVLRLINRFDGLAAYPACHDYVTRATARPSFVKAHADQMAHFAAAD